MTLKSYRLVVFFMTSTISCVAQCDHPAALNRWERAQFIQVAHGQRLDVGAQFLSVSGCETTMMSELRRLGARINFADESSGYAWVTISRDKILDTLDLNGIAFAYTRDDDRLYARDEAAKAPQNERKAQPAPVISLPYPQVARTLASGGPYFATNEIGLSELWRHHPDADGRGVRVAIVDDGLDLLHPALQRARDVAGNLVPKLADMSTLSSPEEDSEWVHLDKSITTHAGTFEADGRTWTAPEDGTYRFGIFQQNLTLGPQGNSHTKKLSLSLGVLWNPLRNEVWVDTDGDGSFENQRALRDYSVSHDIDWFGTKQEEKDSRIPFGIKIKAAMQAVYIRIGDEHGELIAGALAGNTLTGGIFTGAAPNAQLIDENVSRMTLIPAIVQMAARGDVDVVNRSGGIGRAYAESDFYYFGIEDFAQHVLERLFSVYDKPIVAYSATPGTIHVNDYAGPEMLRRNRQLSPPYLETINSFVWDMPNGLVNSVLAPSANLETDSRYMPQDITWDDGRRHTYSDGAFNPAAPDGYVIGANNSPAIPVVSGILADLISEARRDHIRYDATRLNNAIFTGTRLLPDFPLSQQGYGLINAIQSWDQLAKMAKADDPANHALTSFTISRMEKGQSIEVQGFHADVPEPGEKLEGEIWITRHGGYAVGRKYTFSLRGNSGDYELLDHEAILEQDKPTRIRFQTKGLPGWNLVFLELRDKAANAVMQDVPLSVRVPETPKEIGAGVDEYESTIPPLRSEYKYVRVGYGVEAARYVMRIPYTGPCCSTRDFPGAHYHEGVQPPGQPVDAIHHIGPMEEIRSLVANNAPGIQTVYWENRGRPEYATQYDGLAPDVPIHATLTVTKYSVLISKASNQSLSITNPLAAVEGHVEFYDAKVDTSTVQSQGNHGMAEVDYELPANLAQWRVRVTGTIKGAHTDAYLFNCTGKNGCYMVSQQEITDKGASLVVEKPQSGKWKIMVRSREQTTENPMYKLTEAQLALSPSGVSQPDAKHETGETWNVAVPVTARYAAFRIAGTPGVEREKDGLLVAMTPLASDLP